MRIAVLGAGLQGVCCALELARRGWTVELIDREASVMQCASLRNEGKVHLGLVYANDTSGHTASLMLDGATSFARIIDKLVGRPLNWPLLTSSPFTYVVLATTMVAPEQLRSHYTRVSRGFEMRRANGADYLRLAPSEVVREVSLEHIAGAVVAPVLTCFCTEERAVDMAALRLELLNALNRSAITMHYLCDVETVARTSSGFDVSCRQPDKSVRVVNADVVVNCLWDGRLAIDHQLGVLPERPWVHRLKYRLIGRLTQDHAHSLSFVLGPFGDVVVYPTGQVCISWYPVCLAGWSQDVTPPEAWRPAMAGNAAQDSVSRIIEGMRAEFGEIVPALRTMKVESVDAGVIFAWGNEDIHEPSSELHTRSDIGVRDHDGYYSIDTGKLTTAPLFAERLSDALWAR